MKQSIILGVLLLATFAYAQKIPKGWQVIADRTSMCQMAVPADWTDSGIGTAMAPGGKARVGIHPNLRNDTWSHEQKTQKEGYARFKAFDQSDKRLWYSTEPVHKPTHAKPVHWRITVPDVDGIGFCGAAIDIEDASLLPVARKIAETVHVK
jgi:hypothetical protein